MNEFLNKALEFIASANGMSVAIALVLEVVLRLIPSQKPIGVIIMVSDFCSNAGKLLVKVSEFINKVVPQNIK